MNFTDFTDSAAAIDTDYIVGYAAGGGAGSDRRWLRSALLYNQISTLSAIIGDPGAEQGGVEAVGCLKVIEYDTSGNSVATAKFSRTDFVTSGGSDTHVIHAVAVVDASSQRQVNVIGADCDSYNGVDVVAVSGVTSKVASATGGVSYGGFFQVKSFNANCHAIAVQVDCQNNTGAAIPYNASINNFIGLDLVFNASGVSNVDSGAAILFRWNGGSAWDVGLGFVSDSVKTSLIDNDADCVNLWNDTGAHTKGLDFSAATFSGSQIKLALGGSLKDAVNDAAAAGASVAVGEVYRNGSVLMVRVA